MIPISGTGSVLAQVNKPGVVFNIKFRKTNGDVSEKIGCMAVRGGSELSERKVWNRNGLLRITQPAKNHIFDVYIDLILEFNGKPVFHNY
ncbi:MAG: hypothetical protein EAZ80_01605 [Runella slithyformis]|nr:MAG: hypothetical protein EAZ80_01605 [Runella slithyformis]TAF48675.1 MAG: hypothetical protein EAZ63_03750 [Runella slithyformis]